MTRAQIIGGPYYGIEGEIEEQDRSWYTIRTPQGNTVEVHQGQVQVVLEKDLKPRGEKRQWWLMPFDALAFAMSAEPGEGTFEHALATYQADPSPLTISVVFRALLVRLGEYRQALDQIVAVFEHGADKYEPNNWLDLDQDKDSFRREYFSALCRHSFHAQPDPLDPESSIPHLAHAACTALIILTHELEWL